MLHPHHAHSTRFFAAMFVLAALSIATGGTPSFAADPPEVSRPDCKTCATARKDLNAASSRIERTKKRLREEDLSRKDIQMLDARNKEDRITVGRSQLKLDDCRNGCPASLGVKVKPVTIKSCDKCQKLANELAAIQTQIKQVQAEQERLKDLKRDVSLQGKAAIDKQLKTLLAQSKAKTKAFADCEKKFCGKSRDQKKEASAIGGAVKDIMKGLEKDKKTRKSGGS